jgi:pectate lyase
VPARALTGVKRTSFGLFVGFTSTALLVACSGGTSADGGTPPGAFAPAGGPRPGDVTPPPGEVTPPASTNTPNPGDVAGTGDMVQPDDLVNAGGAMNAPDDGNPPVMDPPVVAPPNDPPPPTPGEPEPTNCVIPAVASVPIGYGAATTGGGNAAPVIVNSFAEAEAALAAYRDAFDEGTQNALVLRYTGRFDFSTITDVCAQHTKASQLLEVKEMDNVTFEGASGSSGNFGIHINRAHNVIVRNMTLGLLPGGGDSDAITIEGNGTNGDVENVWIDHNELFSSTKDDCDGAGDTEFDGLIDIKKGARRITVSYNYLHDHQKTGLLGHSDSDDVERFVTFHHNRYENVVSRTPLQRFGLIHIFNNYYGGILDSGINVRMGGIALIESNFFENAANPVTSRFTDVAGFWDLRNNHVGPGITWDVGDDTLANADDWQSTAAYPANELNYAYTPDVAGCVKQIVLAQAGAKL